MDVSKLTDLFQSSYERLTEANSATVLGVITGGVLVISGVYLVARSRSKSRAAKPGLVDLQGGGLDRDEVRKAFLDYR